MNRIPTGALGVLALACLGGPALAQSYPYSTGYPDQGWPAQSYNPQGMPQQGYDQGGQHGYPAPADESYGSGGGYQGQGYQAQGYQAQGYQAGRSNEGAGYPAAPGGYGDRSGWRGPGGDNPPHRADAGSPRRGFYDFEGRADRLEQRIDSAAITNRQRRSLIAQLNSIRSEANYRANRHEGDLRDWDRELLQTRLDSLARQLPRG